jgi:hypothetical protein
MSRKMVLDDSDDEPSKDSPEKSPEESDDMEDDKIEAAHAAVADEDDDDDADEDAEPAAAAAPAAAQQPAAPKVKKPRQPTKKALAAAAAAAAAGGGGLGTDIVSIVKGILSQGLAPEMVASMAEQALKQPEMQAVIQRLNTAGGAAGTPAVAAPGTKVKRTRKAVGPSNFNVIVSACLAAHKAASKEAPMTLMTRAWALLPAEQQQPILEQIQHAR